MGIIDIDTSAVPYRFDINLSGKIYTIQVNYNVTFDIFTIDLSLNGADLIKGEKLVLNQFLFKDIAIDADHNLNSNFPTELLFIASADNNVKRVSFDNLGDTVYLYYAEKEEVS